MIDDPYRAISTMISAPACAAVAPDWPGGDPLIGHDRLIAAWCEDLASGDLARTGRTPRADQVCGLA